MRAVAYMRVSTADQAGEDRYGLPAQREVIVAYAQAHDIEILGWYADEGLSGSTLDRPEFGNLTVSCTWGRLF